MNTPLQSPNDVIATNDHSELLQQDDHMQNMQHTQMTVTAITQPFTSIVRVKGKINVQDIALWQDPNLAIRLEVEPQAGKRPISRVYTVRHFDVARHEIEIDFVKHPEDSPAMRWLNQAQIGSQIGLTGPRAHDQPNVTLSAENQVKHVLIFADDTAIPALYSLLQQWPEAQTASIYIESCEFDILSELPEITGIKTHFFLQPHEVELRDPNVLIDAARCLNLDASKVTVWAACERQQARKIRQYFLEDWALDKADVRVFAYWKQGTSSSQIDELRLEQYANLRDNGHGLQEFDDLDLPI